MIKIRKMTVEDIPAVAELERECFSEPWSEKSLQDSLALDTTCFLVAEEETVLGYVGMYRSFEEGEITNVAVTTNARRKQIGSKLLEELHFAAAECAIERIILEVRESNEAAIGLYRRMGYESIGIRKNFYSFPTENAILMEKRLNHNI